MGKLERNLVQAEKSAAATPHTVTLFLAHDFILWEPMGGNRPQSCGSEAPRRAFQAASHVTRLPGCAAVRSP